MVTFLYSCGGFALGLAVCFGLTVVEWASWMIALPSRRPGTLEAQVTFALDPDCPERRLGDPIEAVAADGVSLAGLWHPSSHPHGLSRGAVIFIHGFAEDPSGLRARMDALNDHGWDVAALDLRAHGRSGGDRGSFGPVEARDIATWIDTLTRSGRLGTDPNVRVAIWGRSMGASVSVHAASSDPRIAAVVLEAPYVDLQVTLRRVLTRKRVPCARLFAFLILRGAGRLSGVSLFRPRPIDLVPRIDVPALIVHGTDDALIPMADVHRLARAFPTPAPVIEVAGAGHNSVVDVGGAPLLDRVATFLDGATSQLTALNASVNRSENAPVVGLMVATPENPPEEIPA